MIMTPSVSADEDSLKVQLRDKIRLSKNFSRLVEILYNLFERLLTLAIKYKWQCRNRDL